MNDTELIDWLEDHDGFALVSDDFGHWACVSEGMQKIPMNPPEDIQSMFFIKKADWKPSIREAILYAMKGDV